MHNDIGAKRRRRREERVMKPPAARMLARGQKVQAEKREAITGSDRSRPAGERQCGL
jgi:hypothetical protein